MKDRDDKPICGYTIEKEWPGHRVVLSRTHCRRIVKVEGERCWQHESGEKQMERYRRLHQPEQSREL